MTNNWIAVASANHVRRGRADGFMQVCHGKGAPLRRMQPGDLVAYYSPTWTFGEAEPCRSFTAMGRVLPRAPYQADMGGGFVAFRRDVAWFDSTDAAIHRLFDHMDFSRGNRSWGYQFRFGLFGISTADMQAIARAMGVGPEMIGAIDPLLV